MVDLLKVTIRASGITDKFFGQMKIWHAAISKKGQIIEGELINYYVTETMYTYIIHSSSYIDETDIAKLIIAIREIDVHCERIIAIHHDMMKDEYYKNFFTRLKESRKSL